MTAGLPVRVFNLMRSLGSIGGGVFFVFKRPGDRKEPVVCRGWGEEMVTTGAKRYLYLFLALVFALLAAMGSYQILTARPAAGSVTVFVARSAIPARTVIGPAQLEARRFPMASYPDAAADPLGKVATVGIVPGEVIVNGMLGQGPAAGGLSAQVPSGSYAMSIAINQITGVDGAIQTGDRVDLVSVNAAGQAVDLLPDVLVLDRNSSVLTLEVSQAEALTVVQAEQRGNLTVLLRGIAR